jgi:hypothetical protein
VNKDGKIFENIIMVVALSNMEKALRYRIHVQSKDEHNTLA